MTIMGGESWEAGRFPGEFGHLEGNFAFFEHENTARIVEILLSSWEINILSSPYIDNGLWLFEFSGGRTVGYSTCAITEKKKNASWKLWHHNHHLFLENTFAIHKPFSHNFVPPVMKYAHNFVEAVNACTITGMSEYFLIFVSSWFQFTIFTPPSVK